MTKRIENLLKIADATIARLERHAPGSAKGTLDLIRAELNMNTEREQLKRDIAARKSGLLPVSPA